MSSPLKVVTYNVLANDCMRPEFYPNVIPENLSSYRRYSRLVEKILRFDAEIICLQEVDNHLYGLLAKYFAHLGYRGFHQLKTGKTDGLATFLKQDLCREFKYDILRFDGVGLNKKPIAHIATILRLTIGSSNLVITNTHLKWDHPNTPLDARIGYNHAQQLIKALDSLPMSPKIIMGDFNAEPTNEILTAFELHGYCDVHDASTSTFNAASGGARKIDYMLCSDRIIFKPLPTPKITDDTALPSEIEPSDHLPLMAEFTLIE